MITGQPSTIIQLATGKSGKCKLKQQTCLSLSTGMGYHLSQAHQSAHLTSITTLTLNIQAYYWEKHLLYGGHTLILR